MAYPGNIGQFGIKHHRGFHGDEMQCGGIDRDWTESFFGQKYSLIVSSDGAKIYFSFVKTQ